jgi:two-component system, OmpR family, response regulator PhoP
MNIPAEAVVIVVEDNTPEREETVLALELAGLRALGAADGPALNGAMISHRVDIVVLDLGLPGESGLEIAARLIGQPSPVGIIMLTGKGLMNERLLGLRQGADAYLVKPVDPRELIASVLALRRRLGISERGQASAEESSRELAPMFAAKTTSSSRSTQHLKLSPGGLHLSARGGEAEIALSDLQRRLLLNFKGVKIGQPVSREDLMVTLGHGQSNGDYHRLETLVSRFRLKVRTELNEELPLQAIPGQGYALTKPILFPASD